MHAQKLLEPRILPPVALAFAITASLFVVMQHLIRTEHSVLTDAPASSTLTILRELPEVLETRPTRRPPQPPVPPEPEPPRPVPEAVAGGEPVGVTVAIAPHQVPREARPTRSGDGTLTRIFLPAPAYPERAARLGIEGHVTLMFTVTEAGTVRDVEVIEAEPPNHFERAAIEAVMRSRYRPQVREGRPVAVAGVVQRIAFELEK